MTFHVGQKVVCVEEGNPAGGYGNEVIAKKGSVYTVRELLVIANTPLLRLVEITNSVRPYLYGNYEIGFHRNNFRPVQERKTDISIFTDILRKVERKHKRSVHA